MRIFAARQWRLGRGMNIAMAGAVLCSALSLSCSVNVLENFADKNSNEALFVNAKTDINNGDYDAAIAKFNLMTGSYLTDRHIIFWKAKAYAGICGLRTLQFVQDFSAASTSHLFPFLVSEFVGGTPARIDACIAAENLVESIGVIANRTADENLLLALISFSKMGNILSLYTDADQDGAADSGVDVCLKARATRPTAAVAGDFFDADLREFGTGLTLAMANMAAVAETVSFGSGSFSNVTALCTSLPSDFCSTFDPAAFSGPDLFGIQTLIKEGAVVGLNILPPVAPCTDGGAYTACHCP